MKSIVLAIGLVVGLASCGEKSESGATADSEMKIAYYVQDSISEHLDYFISSQDEIEELERAYNEKVAKFQGEYQRLGGEYQSKMAQGLLSANGEKYYQKQLQGLELEMTSLQQTEGLSLETKARDFQLSLIEKLADYGKEYANENGITLFLAKDNLGTIAYADSSMDITMKFIDFINEKEKSGSDEASE
ncbi:MAG: OmpH family outer membrane protein [Crocinitomicaceae bacterium]|nr:OmpH family outer membrane protein [Crocinitomicaceae bacterium]MDG1658040.1 OmpH family outer membrane protein [Crocinitomicaceae bacterium]MDG2440121.1 OmpH family outer membrane protein [Crocinitomicaceae bacterium]|tara:strand:- start:684 stop:1253 length:570 start_codon:yes stop_codon:yes gene_type:complete